MPVIKTSLMYRRFLFFLFSLVILVGCQQESPDQNADLETPPAVSNDVASTASTVPSSPDRAALERQVETTLKASSPKKKDLKELSKWLADQEVSTLIDLKKNFDRGLMLNQGSADIARVYQFHAHGTRMEMMDQTTLAHYFPYNGEFDQNEFRNRASQLDFLNKNCGFQIKTNKEELLTFNHYCFNKDNQLFELYKAEGSAFLNRIINEYQEAKAITPAMKQQFYFNAMDDLDMTRLEHQIFYMLFHVLVNEEIVTYKEVQALTI